MVETSGQEPQAPPHPNALLFLVIFKATAMVYYVLCGWLPLNFVVNFCVVVFLLMCDFWTVRLGLLGDPLPLSFELDSRSLTDGFHNPLFVLNCRSRMYLED